MIHGADNIRARLKQLPALPLNVWPRTTRVAAQWEPTTMRALPHGTIWVVATYIKMRPNDPTVVGEIFVDGIRRRPCIRTRPGTLLQTTAINRGAVWLAAQTQWPQIGLDPNANYGVWKNTAFVPCVGFEGLNGQYVISTPGYKRGSPYIAEVTYHTVA